MAKNNARSEDIKTPLGVASFTKDLFVARERENGSKGYGCTILFAKTADISALKDLAVKTATEAWGDKAKQWIKDGLIKSPFLDGDGPQGLSKKSGERHAGYAGHTFIRCTSGAEFKPKVFDRQRNPVMEADGIPSGSQVYAVVNCYTWENDKNGKGISFGVSLLQVVKKAEGDEILGGGGGPSADKYFDAIEDDGESAPANDGQGAAGLFG